VATAKRNLLDSSTPPSTSKPPSKLTLFTNLAIPIPTNTLTTQHTLHTQQSNAIQPLQERNLKQEIKLKKNLSDLSFANYALAVVMDVSGFGFR